MLNDLVVLLRLVAPCWDGLTDPVGSVPDKEWPGSSALDGGIVGLF